MGMKMTSFSANVLIGCLNFRRELVIFRRVPPHLYSTLDRKSSSRHCNMSPPIYLIAAACENLGIGYKGDLPWKLKKEMAYFNRMTTKTDNPDKQNAVLMGRKTWFSIPEKFRPLPKRINIVMSKNLKELPDAHFLTSSINDAFSWLKENPVDKLWIVGGSDIYKMAMEIPADRIYLTKIMADFECDVFFPKIDSDKFELIKDPDVPHEIQEENGLKYKYEVYERKNTIL